jgi:hypothetical protein
MCQAGAPARVCHSHVRLSFWSVASRKLSGVFNSGTRPKWLLFHTRKWQRRAFRARHSQTRIRGGILHAVFETLAISRTQYLAEPSFVAVQHQGVTLLVLFYAFVR